MSSRTKDLPKHDNVANDIMNDETDTDLSPPGPETNLERGKIPKVTRKVAGRPGRKRQGKLRHMLDMPLDVVLEICSHLLPRDLLHLARTSKSLRSFFMSRSSRSMWKSACTNVPGLPPCPSDLSEPAYANLMFDAHCHECLKKNCNHFYPTLRVRICRSCRKSSSLVIRVWDVGRDFNNFGLSHFTHSYFLPEVIRTDSNMFLRQDVADFIKLLKETPIEEREVFLSIRKKAVSEIGKSAVALQGWLESTKTFRSDELNELRHSRRKAILEKLREDGRWQEELGEIETTCYLEERFNMLPEVRKPQALTAKIWANIKGPVIAFMQQRKDERIAEMRRMAMEDRMRAMCEFAKTILMRIPVFSLSTLEIAIHVPEIQRLIDPDERTFNPEDLEEPIKKHLVAVARDRREVFRQSIVRECGMDGSTDPFALRLAVGALFACTSYGCAEPLFLAQAIFHRCHPAYGLQLEKPEHTSTEFFVAAKRFYFSDETPISIWCKEQWYEEGITVMRRIVEACGMDCKTATVDDLDRADIRLRCVCNSHLKARDWRPIMTWRMAMANWVRERGRCAHFEKATDAETAAAKPMEAVALALFKKQWDEQNKFLCRHCSGSHMTKSWVLSHIQESHAIAEPSDDDWVDAHNTMQIPYPVWLVSAKLHNEAPAYPTSVWFRDGVAAYFED